MRVLILSTRIGIDADYVADLRRRLPSDAEIDLRVVAIHRPGDKRLDVSRYLAVGPALRPGRAVLEYATATTPPKRAKRLAARRKAHKESRRARVDRAVRRLTPARFAKDRALLLATGVRRAAVVHEEFARADFVVAMDWDSTYAAWQLAQRFTEPHVVMGPEGVTRKRDEIAAP